MAPFTVVVLGFDAKKICYVNKLIRLTVNLINLLTLLIINNNMLLQTKARKCEDNEIGRLLFSWT